jgi:hypothetical protein
MAGMTEKEWWLCLQRKQCGWSDIESRVARESEKVRRAG